MTLATLDRPAPPMATDLHFQPPGGGTACGVIGWSTTNRAQVTCAACLSAFEAGLLTMTEAEIRAELAIDRLAVADRFAPNRGLAYEVLAQIAEAPEAWDEAEWEHSVAGYACRIYRLEILRDDSVAVRDLPPVVAEEVLYLQHEEIDGVDLPPRVPCEDVARVLLRVVRRQMADLTRVDLDLPDLRRTIAQIFGRPLVPIDPSLYLHSIAPAGRSTCGQQLAMGDLVSDAALVTCPECRAENTRGNR